jgi:predicted RNase H-like HicB family nuclease
LDEEQFFEDLAVPYVAVVYSLEGPDGEWIRRAEYPELRGCFADAPSADEAMEALEARRVAMLFEFRSRGEEPPRPRPPLRSGVSCLSDHLASELANGALGAAARMAGTE